MSRAIYSATEMIVRVWVRLYLVGMPAEARRQRTAEIASDLHEYRREVRERGRSSIAAALLLLVRCVAGVLDDLFWRYEERGAWGGTWMLGIKRAAVRVGLVTGLLLLIPLTAELIFDEMAWSAFDFVFAGVLLFGAGLTYEVVASRAPNLTYQAAVGLALMTSLFLIVTNGAVGIIGSEDNPANIMYFGVLAVGFLGAIVARLQPDGMARALYAMAAAQASIAVIALVAGAIDPTFWAEAPGTPVPSRWYQVFQIVGANGMFITLFLASAFLFRNASSGPNRGTQGRRADPHAG